MRQCPARAPAGCFALQQQLAEGGRAERQAEAEKIQRRQGGNGAAQDKGQKGEGRHHRVGQHMPQDDLPVANP